MFGAGNFIVDDNGTVKISPGQEEMVLNHLFKFFMGGGSIGTLGDGDMGGAGATLAAVYYDAYEIYDAITGNDATYTIVSDNGKVTFGKIAEDKGNGNSQQAYTPAPKNGLPGFPDAGKGQFNNKSKRWRWKLPDGSILEWDSQHEEVEKYDRSGKTHEGAYDPNTGERIKDGDVGRSTPKFSTPVTQPYDGPQYLPAYQPGMGNYNRNVTNGVIMGGAAIIIMETVETYWPAVLAF